MARRSALALSIPVPPPGRPEDATGDVAPLSSGRKYPLSRGGALLSWNAEATDVLGDDDVQGGPKPGPP